MANIFKVNNIIQQYELLALLVNWSKDHSWLLLKVVLAIILSSMPGPHSTSLFQFWARQHIKIK